MKKIYKLICILAALYFLINEQTFAAEDCVVLIHGMNRTTASFIAVASYLRTRGYHVETVPYPSRTKTVQDIAHDYLQKPIQSCQAKKARRIHIVTHSIGGLIIRSYLTAHRLPPGSRIVMLAPPNHGSQIANLLQDSMLFHALMGPMGKQLKIGADGIANRLPEKFPYDIGIITGKYNPSPLAACTFSSANDGKVSVKSAKLSGMKDFLVVDSSHTFILMNPRVIRAIYNFLQNGAFS